MGQDTKFTPGPWALDEWGWIAASDGEPVAMVSANELSSQELADAHLISAAPELYEALECLCRAWERGQYAGHPTWDVALSALAKARGEQ